MTGSFRYFGGFLAGIALTMAGMYGLAYWVQGSAPESGRWTAEILAKKRVAAERGPKLLIVGGSNALFGFSAERIERKYGITAANLGSHAGLGLRYILDFARPFVKPEMIVVMPIEYSFYERPRGSMVEFLQLVGYDFPYFRSLSFLQQIDVLTGTEWVAWPVVIKAKLVGGEPYSNGYQSRTINAYGDETANRMEMRNPRVVARLAAIKKGGRYTVSPEAIAVIGEFAEFARQRGARAVVTFPNILRNTVDFDANKSFFADLAREFAALDIPLIGSPEASAFDIGYVFDTPFHQTREGQAAASDRLVSDLRHAGLL
jgi:hypothetical protein